jgi:peptidyl-prolyl cis-trans isomerase C
MSESHSDLPAKLYAYPTLKLAQELFQKTPRELGAAQRQRVDAIVARQIAMERRILASSEAAQVVLPPSSAAEGLAEIRGRYASEAEFVADLDASELDPATLELAIARQLKVDAVLERVAGQVAEVSDIDVEIYYLMHRERFFRPENRTLRHILVTINDDLAGSDRASARDKIEAIRERLRRSPKRFGEQALKHSECPTALSSGRLGVIKRGQLFPELEAVAFELSPGAISCVVESPLGFHILQCVASEAECLMPLDSVHDAIRGRISESRRRACQKAWIGALNAVPA